MTPRPISNKTRIETLCLNFPPMSPNCLPDRFPTKQGLKPRYRQQRRKRKDSPRPISNKTRIETNWIFDFSLYSLSPRPISNKTRIETERYCFAWNIARVLPDRFPTKQGLKQHVCYIDKIGTCTPRPISNKTRIETAKNRAGNYIRTKLPDRFPTKQGLKLLTCLFALLVVTLPDRFPTKQGLKLSGYLIRFHMAGFSQTDFQQNKDWNAVNPLSFVAPILLPDRFPTKQGLKPTAAFQAVRCPSLPDRFPTKQGLKQDLHAKTKILKLSPRPISNKTRIETQVFEERFAAFVNSQTDFQQNKDWNYYFCFTKSFTIFLPDRFPTKQGLKLKTCSLYQTHRIGSQTDFQQNKDWNSTASFSRLWMCILPDRFPTKQGLKLRKQRAVKEWNHLSQTDFQQNKDWNYVEYWGW